MSYDDGENWHSMRSNLPVAPVYDLAIKDDDLVAATHGRAFWIMDGLSLLRQVSGEFADEEYAPGKACHEDTPCRAIPRA